MSHAPSRAGGAGGGGAAGSVHAGPLAHVGRAQSPEQHTESWELGAGSVLELLGLLRDPRPGPGRRCRCDLVALLHFVVCSLSSCLL